MALYAVGDIQGCRRSLETLLSLIRFDPEVDHVVMVGDLVNRGPDSGGVLELVMELGDSASCVLGNHDLNTLAVADGVRPEKPRDTIGPLVRSARAGELFDWLCRRPLLIEREGYLFCHAGIYPGWGLDEAMERAGEVERVLVSSRCRDFLSNMFGSEPARWHPRLRDWDRLRFITNAFTRMRYLDDDGALDFLETGPPGTQRPGLSPWYQHRAHKVLESTVVFGHWSSLGYHQDDGVIALDTGCVWGRYLTAVRLSDTPPTPFHLRCKETG